VLGATDSPERGLLDLGERGRAAAGRGLSCSAAKSSTSSERTMSIEGLLCG
jgi:hypothetical protein